MSHNVNSCYSTDMDKFYAVYLGVLTVGKQTCMIPRDTQYGGVQNDPPKIRIGVQVLNRALKSFSVASGLSSALTIYPCQIRKFVGHTHPRRLTRTTKQESCAIAKMTARCALYK